MILIDLFVVFQYTLMLLVATFCKNALKGMGLPGVVSPARAAKKRENLKNDVKVWISCINDSTK